MNTVLVVTDGLEPLPDAPAVPPGRVLPEPPAREEQLRYRGVWRQLVLAWAATLRAQLSTAPSADDTTVARVIDLVTTAEDLAAHHRSSPLTWWEGTLSERCWLALHEADALLVRLVDDASLLACLPGIVGRAERQLPADDRTLCAVRQVVLGRPADPWAALAATASGRRLVEELVRQTHHVADSRYAASRSFRNRLVRVTGVLTLMLVLIGVVASLSPPVLRGLPEPPWKGVFIVAVFGAAGAVITAVRPLADSGGTYNPFSLPSWQGAVKVLIGVVSAILGVLAVSAGVIPGVAIAGAADALFWAVVFGASQQALTSTVDSRVQQLTAPAGDAQAGAEPPCSPPAAGAGGATPA